MAYTVFDPLHPDATTDDGVELPEYVRNNLIAIRDGVAMGLMQGFAYAISGGTAAEPNYITLTSGSYVIRATLTWNDGYVTDLQWARSTGGSFEAIGSAGAMTYDGSGNLLSMSGAAGFLGLLLSLLGKVTNLAASFVTHVGLSIGSAHSGAGSMASQSNNNVNIDGGSIDGTPIGQSVRSPVGAKTFQGTLVPLGDISAQGTIIDWSAGDYFTLKITNASASLAWQNLPNGVIQGITLEIEYAGLASSLFPAGVAWPSGVPLVGSGAGRIDIVELSCRDGTNVRAEYITDSRVP